MKASHMLLALFLLSSASYSLNNNKNYPTITSLPNAQLLVHLEPNINLSVTNYGILGPYGIVGPDTTGYSETIPGAVFPAGSDLEYLYFGAIWIGAEIDTVDQYGNPILDTLVSVGTDGWWGNVMELFPEEAPGGGMWREEVMADEEIYGVYYDTCVSTLVVPDPNDQRPHIPLYLKITQHSFGWSSPGYHDFIIIDYIIENIGARYLHNTWIGIYWDGDVFHYSEGGAAGAIDDLCGYVQNGNYKIAWLADNDGQPYDSVFDYRSPTGVMGLTLLGSSTPGLETNFNWWISNINSNFDWGPQLIVNYNGPFPGGGRGTPGGDKAKYRVMSNGEHDYGQMWCDLTVWENNGWIPRSPQSPNLADGYDTRFLISFGPFDLPAGEVETLSVAVIGGSRFHTDPLNYATYLEDRTFDSSSIALYYANLGFNRFVDMVDSVIGFYQLGYINIPPGPPSNFRVAGWAENFVALEWDPVSRPNLLEYRIYRGTEPGVYDPQNLTPDGFLDSVFIDSSVQNNITYYYVILSANILGDEGGYSQETSINTGQPQTPTGLTATAGNSEVELSWDHNPEPDIYGYIIHRSEEQDEFIVIDTSISNAYIDPDLTNGFEYRYYITALDTFQNISFDSDTVSAFPMGLDSGILLINSNSDNPHFNLDYDSMAAFYENILENYNHTIIDHWITHLTELAPYSTTIFARECLLYNYFNPSAYEDVYERYLEAGGNIILAGSRHLAPVIGYQGLLEFDSLDFQYKYLNLAGIEYPNLINNTEFIGANSATPNFDDFILDSIRTGRIVFPPDLPDGRLNGIGALLPNDSSEIIYNYVAVNPDTSNYHGRPIGIIHQTDTYNAAVLEFPLYYVEEPISYQILHRILNDFGEVPTDVDDTQVPLPRSTQLLQNYPNPFNNATTLKYNLARPGMVTITIYNILGQVVAKPVDEPQQAGARTITWNAANRASGIYFARMKTEDYSGSIKLLILK
ncbi:MAG: T9SS type A sorting domain-containing protein [Candidatus Zixiibacteriota bacterium]|nr:MAG: T9SS type A sorting domain-containing protein [candidate division Zixibacteria bacterium]